MIRTLKPPKLQLNIKFILKNKIHFIIRNLEKNNYINTFELKYNVNELKNEFVNLNNDIKKLESSLLELKDNLGYDEFLESNNNFQPLTPNASYTQNETVIDSIEPKTQALTVVKTRNTFKY